MRYCEEPHGVTVDEIIALLRKTSLPTVIVEGDDDIIVFRRLESIFIEKNLSVIAAGGRDKLLTIFNRRHEIGKCKEIVFVADRDAWVFSEVPHQYNSDVLFFTDGYSIENDVFRDGNVEEMMSTSEYSRFVTELNEFVKWYALAFYRLLKGEEEVISIHPNVVLDNLDRKQKLMEMREGEEYPHEIYEKILGNYRKYLRGKSLIGIALRQLSYPGRNPQHHPKTLLEIFSFKGGPLIGSLFAQIGSRFEKPDDLDEGQSPA